MYTDDKRHLNRNEQHHKACLQTGTSATKIVFSNGEIRDQILLLENEFKKMSAIYTPVSYKLQMCNIIVLELLITKIITV